MNEFELIATLTRGLSTTTAVISGPGDDCAVLDLGVPDRWVLLKTDAVVEGVHFDRTAEPERIGHKALGRCLSDVAAMGGAPVSAVVTLGLPREFDPVWLERLYKGMDQLAVRHRVAISGGETTSNLERLLISVAMVGTVDRLRCALRSGARVGDAIFVTGDLGGSASGRHLDFEPRVEEGLWLAESFSIHAMMDISDGLAGDLRHIMRSSGVGAELRAASIPISRAARQAVRGKSSAKPALLAALTDGEDFELLFTVAGGDSVRVLDAWRERFPGTRLTCVGKISDQPGLRLWEDGRTRELNVGGFTHFS